jgi:cation efflux family protein
MATHETDTHQHHGHGRHHGVNAHADRRYLTGALALIARRLASRPPEGGFTYGLKRAENFSAQINGLTLPGLAAYFVFEGIRRLIAPPPVEGGLPPSWWTRVGMSCGRRELSRVVPLFVFVGAEGVVGGVPTACVVADQQGEDVLATGVPVAVVAGALNRLAFQRGVEAFAGRVVHAAADGTHRPGDPELVAEDGEGRQQ